MTLNEAFAQALSQSNITKLEMSWSMRVTQERLDEILNGAEYNQQEELIMYRFIFKINNKKKLI